MIKKINMELCIGCGLCADICPEDVIRFDEVKKKPYIAYAKDCTACRWCIGHCPMDAIDGDYRRPRKLPSAYL
jgi:ferredoxin